MAAAPASGVQLAPPRAGRGSRVGHLYELAPRGPHKRREAVLVPLTEQSELRNS
ncbi:hypothetical protein ACSCBZ_15565 [Streptomyces niveiscabiei]|uniref:Uncharacterized protein n=1 Tax=Streptomyces niveiscabiei TaxID=164115 RepID=A0ABW9HL69_9ACTN|nr:hypothetical protein [Streptomyces sp. V2]